MLYSTVNKFYPDFTSSPELREEIHLKGGVFQMEAALLAHQGAGLYTLLWVQYEQTKQNETTLNQAVV